METDSLIQRTVRAQFSDRTVLTIAHRLATVMVRLWPTTIRSPSAAVWLLNLSSCTLRSVRAAEQDSDRVLVLDKGRVGEFDRPAVLLRKPPTEGLLSSMVESTGPQSARFLRQIADGVIDIFGNRK